MFFGKKKTPDELKAEYEALEAQSKQEREKYNERRQYEMLAQGVETKRKELRAQKFGNSSLGMAVQKVKPFAQKVAAKAKSIDFKGNSGGAFGKLRDMGDWAKRANSPQKGGGGFGLNNPYGMQADPFGYKKSAPKKKSSSPKSVTIKFG